MITTKLARRVLTKREQLHLTEVKIRSMGVLKEQVEWMRKMEPKNPGTICLDCWRIARKLGVFGEGER